MLIGGKSLRGSFRVIQRIAVATVLVERQSAISACDNSDISNSSGVRSIRIGVIGQHIADSAGVSGDVKAVFSHRVSCVCISHSHRHIVLAGDGDCDDLRCRAAMPV